MPTQLALVLFDHTPVIGTAALLDGLASHWPGLAQPSELKDEHGSMTFMMDEIIAGIGLIRAPVPWGDLEAPCRDSKLWFGATEALRGHSEHAIVSVLGEASPIALATALTRVTAALLLACRQAVGIYWNAARMVVRPDLFRRVAIEVLNDKPPVMIWIDFQVGWREYRVNSAGYTRGLAQFGLNDFETLDAPEKPSQLRARLEALAAYQLKTGGAVRDRDSIGQDSRERIQVVRGPSTFGVDGPVMRLVYQR
ncbi:MAG: DUF4261 domain-containing protein [Burkholderiaceae bacterium]